MRQAAVSYKSVSRWQVFTVLLQSGMESGQFQGSETQLEYQIAKNLIECSDSLQIFFL